MARCVTSDRDEPYRQEALDGKAVEWMEHVSDAVYAAAARTAKDDKAGLKPEKRT